MLNRIGSKQTFANEIIKYFPQHTIYIEPFFGGGGIFFNKEKSKLSILNDFNLDIYNYWQVISKQESREKLIDKIIETPLHTKIFEQYKNKTFNDDDILEKTLQFIYLSNFSFKGLGNTMRVGNEHLREFTIKKLKKFSNFIFEDCIFMCSDFRVFLKNISFRNEREKNKSFVYADPPYCVMSNKNKKLYKLKWCENDLIDLIEILINLKLKFAISEYYSDFTFKLAENYNLNLIKIRNVNKINKNKIEILITNYETINLFNYEKKL